MGKVWGKGTGTVWCRLQGETEEIVSLFPCTTPCLCPRTVTR